MLAWQDDNRSLLENFLWLSADQSQKHLGELKQLILLEFYWNVTLIVMCDFRMAEEL